MPLLRSSAPQKWRDYWQRLRALPIHEARAEAAGLLSKRDAFATTEGLPEPERFKNWAPELQALLGRYELIECQTGDARISRSQIRPVAGDAEFTAIGSNENATVVVRPGEDTIYELDAKGNAPPWLAAPLPSLWHWILWTHFVNEMDPTSSTRDKS